MKRFALLTLSFSLLSCSGVGSSSSASPSQSEPPVQSTPTFTDSSPSSSSSSPSSSGSSSESLINEEKPASETMSQADWDHCFDYDQYSNVSIDVLLTKSFPGPEERAILMDSSAYYFEDGAMMVEKGEDKTYYETGDGVSYRYEERDDTYVRVPLNETIDSEYYLADFFLPLKQGYDDITYNVSEERYYFRGSILINHLDPLIGQAFTDVRVRIEDGRVTGMWGNYQTEACIFSFIILLDDFSQTVVDLPSYQVEPSVFDRLVDASEYGDFTANCTWLDEDKEQEINLTVVEGYVSFYVVEGEKITQIVYDFNRGLKTSYLLDGADYQELEEPLENGYSPADCIDEAIPSFVGCEEYFALDGNVYSSKEPFTASLAGKTITINDAALIFEGEHLTSMELIFDLDGQEVIYLLTFADFGSAASIA